jgi:hypothetical protein
MKAWQNVPTAIRSGIARPVRRLVLPILLTACARPAAHVEQRTTPEVAALELRISPVNYGPNIPVRFAFVSGDSSQPLRYAEAVTPAVIQVPGTVFSLLAQARDDTCRIVVELFRRESRGRPVERLATGQGRTVVLNEGLSREQSRLVAVLP